MPYETCSMPYSLQFQQLQEQQLLALVEMIKDS